MIGALIALVLGFAGGAVMGFVIGTESTGRCAECVWGAEAQYRRGMEVGWTDCAAQFAHLLRLRAVEAKNTYTITKPELDRLEKEMAEHDFE